MSAPSRLKAVVFDWAGTVIDFGSRAAIANSLTLGFTVATVALLVGAPLAWGLARLARGSKSLFPGLLNVATNFSGIGLGFAYVAALGTYGMVTLALQGAGLPFAPPSPNSFRGLVLAYEYGNVPMFVLFSLPAMTLLRDEWWEAAQCCLASRLRFWRHVGRATARGRAGAPPELEAPPRGQHPHGMVA